MILFLDFDPTSVIDDSSTCLLEKSYRDICANRLKERQQRKKMMIDSQEIRKRKSKYILFNILVIILSHTFVDNSILNIAGYSESSESSDSPQSLFKKTCKNPAVKDTKVNSPLPTFSNDSLPLFNRRQNFRFNTSRVVNSSTDSDDKSSCKKQFPLVPTKNIKRKVKKRW